MVLKTKSKVAWKDLTKHSNQIIMMYFLTSFLAGTAFRFEAFEGVWGQHTECELTRSRNLSKGVDEKGIIIEFAILVEMQIF